VGILPPGRWLSLHWLALLCSVFGHQGPEERDGWVSWEAYCLCQVEGEGLCASV